MLKKYGAKVVSLRGIRSQARNAGSNLARGAFIFSVDSDMELTKGVVADCVAKCREGFDAVIIPEVSVGLGFWARCKALEKSCYAGDELLEASRFFKREAFEKVKGYDSDLEMGEDWDLNQRIRKAGYKIGRINLSIRHYNGRFSLLETMKKNYRYGKSLERYKKKNPNEAKQQLRLIRPAFVINRGKIAKDPIGAIGLVTLRICEFGAGGIGYVQSKFPGPNKSHAQATLPKAPSENAVAEFNAG